MLLLDVPGVTDEPFCVGTILVVVPYEVYVVVLRLLGVPVMDDTVVVVLVDDKIVVIERQGFAVVVVVPYAGYAVGLGL